MTDEDGIFGYVRGNVRSGEERGEECFDYGVGVGGEWAIPFFPGWVRIVVMFFMMSLILCFFI